MVQKFVDSTEYKDFAEDETLDNLVVAYLDGKNTHHICVLEPGKGFIAGIGTIFPFGPHVLATETAWWIEPDSRGLGLGVQLLQAFEYWAKEKAGCSMVSMSSLDDKVGEMYLKQGYKLYERAYMKVL
jgi:GNAT superfamily N-acetyltransferase